MSEWMEWSDWMNGINKWMEWINEWMYGYTLKRFYLFSKPNVVASSV